MRRIDFAAGFALVLASIATALAAAELPLERISLPPGFTIELWARVDNARQMTLGRHDDQGGMLFVGSMHAGKVHALSYGADYRVRGVSVVASGLQRPVGVAYRQGSLYVSAVNRIDAWAIIREIVPFIAVLVSSLLLLVLVPDLVMFLPHQFGY